MPRMSSGASRILAGSRPFSQTHWAAFTSFGPYLTMAWIWPIGISSDSAPPIFLSGAITGAMVVLMPSQMSLPTPLI